MTVVGPGVFEIRVRTGVEHRIFYVARFAEAVYVLHAFQKKTRQTCSDDVEVGRRRLVEIVVRRRGT